jgi:hypothetical protein
MRRFARQDDVYLCCVQLTQRRPELGDDDGQAVEHPRIGTGGHDTDAVAALDRLTSRGNKRDARGIRLPLVQRHRHLRRVVPGQQTGRARGRVRVSRERQPNHRQHVLECLNRDRARPQHLRRTHRQVENCGLDANVGRAAVDEHVDSPVQILDDVRGPGRARPRKQVGAWRGHRDRGRGEQRPCDRMRRDTDRNGLEARRHLEWD